MAKILDLNSVEQRPTLELTLQDKEKTTLQVTIPTEGLVNELEDMGPELTRIVSKGDKEGLDQAFDLAARLISCNRNGVTITADELRNKYNMALETLIVFMSAYLDFITEITERKN